MKIVRVERGDREFDVKWKLSENGDSMRGVIGVGGGAMIFPKAGGYEWWINQMGNGSAPTLDDAIADASWALARISAFEAEAHDWFAHDGPLVLSASDDICNDCRESLNDPA